MADPTLYAHSDTLSRVWARGTHALIVVGILSLAVLGLVVQNHRLVKLWEQWDGPVFVFVDGVCRAHPTDYKAVEFNPQDTRFEDVIKSSLGEFCRLQFQVQKATAAEDLPRALLFMAAAKARPFASSYRDGYINRLLHDPATQETTVEVQNVGLASLGPCGSAGQRACSGEIEFQQVKGREVSSCIVNLEFQFEDVRGNPRKYLVNPLGIAVTDFSNHCGVPRQISSLGR